MKNKTEKEEIIDFIDITDGQAFEYYFENFMKSNSSTGRLGN